MISANKFKESQSESSQVGQITGMYNHCMNYLIWTQALKTKHETQVFYAPGRYFYNKWFEDLNHH